MTATVLLVPGMLNDARLWDAVAVSLARSAPSAELRRMDALSQDTVPAMAQAAWQRLADLPPDAPVVLVGFSLGGYVAIEMLAHPQRALRGAVLVSTSARAESAPARAAREKTIAGIRKDFARVVDGVAAFVTHTPALHAARLQPMMLGVGADVAIRQNQAVMQRHDHHAALAALALPVTVLCGQQDRVTPPELSQELAALVPGARLQIVDACGHMLPIERPDALAEAIRQMLPSPHP